MLFELLWYFKSTFRWDSFVKGIFQGFLILLITYTDEKELLPQVALTLIG